MDTTTKTWEAHVREASATADAGKQSGADRVRARLAHRFERAHELALADAKRLAESAALIVRRLECEGLAATTGGIGFFSEAQATRESIVTFEQAREAFRVVLSAYDDEGGKGG